MPTATLPRVDQWQQRRARGRMTWLVAAAIGVALLLVAGLVLAGLVVWRHLHRTPLEQALRVVPASSLRVGFTDWGVVRQRLGAHLGDTPSRSAVDELMSKAYDADWSAASSINDSAGALQEKYGFSPATAQWEAYAQGRQGATMVLKVAAGTDFDVLAGNLRSDGYTRPRQSDGVWKGGADLVAQLDPTLTPELQYVVLLADQGLVVSSDNPDFAGLSGKVASGNGDSVSSQAGVSDVAGRLGQVANAQFWVGDFACSELAMSKADQASQDQAAQLVRQAGGVTPLAGLAMAMEPDRTLRVVEHFEDSERARRNLLARARLAVGDAVGRGGSFSDDFRLTRSRAVGPDVLLDLRPKAPTGFVLSALYDGPVLFATC